MACARQGCGCPMGETPYEMDGKRYCCEKCAKECTDGDCRCTEADCHS
jgi:hypothetical protein